MILIYLFRLGSSELCLQLAELLNEVLVSWPSWDWHRPEWVYVRWTLSRLILLLSTNHLQIFQARLPSQTVLATELCTFLDTSLSNNSVSQLKSIVSMKYKINLSLNFILFLIQFLDCGNNQWNPIKIVQYSKIFHKTSLYNIRPFKWNPRLFYDLFWLFYVSDKCRLKKGMSANTQTHYFISQPEVHGCYWR